MIQRAKGVFPNPSEDDEKILKVHGVWDDDNNGGTRGRQRCRPADSPIKRWGAGLIPSPHHLKVMILLTFFPQIGLGGRSGAEFLPPRSALNLQFLNLPQTQFIQVRPQSLQIPVRVFHRRADIAVPKLVLDIRKRYAGQAELGGHGMPGRIV